MSAFHPLRTFAACGSLEQPFVGGLTMFRLVKVAPSHGWNAVGWELGIVVVGVLIALGAQQIVESLYWRGKVATERRALLREAQDTYDSIALRWAQQRCVDKRLAEIAIVLERHRRGENLGIVNKVGLPTRQTATRGTWQIAIAGQALSHMTNDEKLKLSDHFLGFDLWDQAGAAEREAWLRITPLSYPDLLTENDWSGVLSAFASAVALNDRMRVFTQFQLEKARELGLRTSPAPVTGSEGITTEICKPLLAALPKGEV